jgi:ribosome-binding protein aMBF1 (putative translation factor)
MRGPPGRPAAKTAPPVHARTRYGLRVSKPRVGTFGRYLARRMVERGFTTSGELAREVGVSPSDVSRWINGRTQPSVPVLRKLAPILRVPVVELLIQAEHLTRREVEDSFEQMCNERKPT